MNRSYDNNLAHPALFFVIAATVAALPGIKLSLKNQAMFKAWFASPLTIIGATSNGVLVLYLYMFPSSLDPQLSLTVCNVSSSPLTLKIMLMMVALIFVPIVLVFQNLANKTFPGQAADEELIYIESC
jgi:cytochrome d ubiquinol oxidase subunit II